MTINLGDTAVSLTPLDEHTLLVDRNAFLETEIATQMAENDMLRSCVIALEQVRDELRRALYGREARNTTHGGEQ